MSWKIWMFWNVKGWNDKKIAAWTEQFERARGSLWSECFSVFTQIKICLSKKEGILRSSFSPMAQLFFYLSCLIWQAADDASESSNCPDINLYSLMLPQKKCPCWTFHHWMFVCKDRGKHIIPPVNTITACGGLCSGSHFLREDS